MNFSKNDVEMIMGIVHDIAPDKMATLKNLLQKFELQNFPSRVNESLEDEASFSWEHLILLGLTLEYLEVGATPTRSVKEVIKYEFVLLESIAAILNPKLGQVEDNKKYFLMSELSALLPFKKQRSWSNELKLLSIKEINEIFSMEGSYYLLSPYAIIDLRQFVGGLYKAVSQARSLPEDAVGNSLRDWAAGYI